MMTPVPRFPFHRDAWQDVRATATHDLGAFADELVTYVDALALSPDERAGSLHERATECFQRAEATFDSADEIDDFAEITAEIGRGRYLLTCVRARLEGAPEPDIAQPCFFDPRHGPATRHIVWTPPTGDPRTVPTCVSDGALVEGDEQPQPRLVAVDKKLMPYWEAPLSFVPWFSGYFESVRGLPAADLLAGLPLGEGFTDGGDSDGGDLVVTRKELRDRWLDRWSADVDESAES